MTYVSRSVTADDLRHELIAYAEENMQREFRISENSRLKVDQSRARARYTVWKNFVSFLKELVIEGSETGELTRTNEESQEP